MPRITINIDCAPHELAGVLSSIRDGFVADEERTYPHTQVEQVLVGGIDRTPSPFWGHPTQAGEAAEGESLKAFAGVGTADNSAPPATGNAQQLATGDKVARKRRTKAEIAADEAASAAAADARKAAENVTKDVQTATEALSGAPVAGETFQQAREAAADEAQSQPVSSLFTLGGGVKAPEPPTSPAVTEPAADAVEASYETLQAEVVALTKAKVPFKSINEIISKHNAAAGAASAREMNATQRGACVLELKLLNKDHVPA